MTPKEAKIFNICEIVQPVYFINRFGVGMLANVQQRLNAYSSKLLKQYLQTFVGKWLKIERKSKMSKFLSISDIFSEFLIDWKISVSKSFEKVQLMKLGPKHVFQNNSLIYGRILENCFQEFSSF